VQNTQVSMAPAEMTPDGTDRLQAAQAAQAFGEALVAGDAAAAASCFSSNACLLTPDGTEIVGRARIHGVLVQLTAPGRRIRFESPRIVTVDRVAVCSQRWTISTAGTDVETFEQSFGSTMALGRSDREGPWQVLIAKPWGACW
jgi:ketosteroid isomerase-like protein